MSRKTSVTVKAYRLICSKYAIMLWMITLTDDMVLPKLRHVRSHMAPRHEINDLLPFYTVVVRKNNPRPGQSDPAELLERSMSRIPASKVESDPPRTSTTGFESLMTLKLCCTRLTSTKYHCAMPSTRRRLSSDSSIHFSSTLGQALRLPCSLRWVSSAKWPRASSW